MSMQDKVNEFMRLRQQGVSAREAYVQVFPNGIEQEIAREQADAQADAGMGQVAGLVGGALTAKGVGDVITGAPEILGVVNNPFAADAANTGSQILTEAIAPAAQEGAAQLAGQTGGDVLAQSGADLASEGVGIGASLGPALQGTLGAAGLALGAKGVYDAYEDGSPVMGGISGAGAGLGASMLGSALGLTAIPGIGWLAGGGALLGAGLGLLGDRETTTEHQQKIAQRLAGQYQDDALYQRLVSGMAQAIQEGPQDPSKPFFGKYGTWDEYKAAGLNAEDLSGQAGVLEAVGGLNLTLPQIHEVTQRLIDADLLFSEKGAVKASDPVLARQIAEQVASGQMPSEPNSTTFEQQQPLTTEMEGSSAMLGQRPILQQRNDLMEQQRNMPDYFEGAPSGQYRAPDGINTLTVRPDGSVMSTLMSTAPIDSSMQNMFSGLGGFGLLPSYSASNPALTTPQQIGIQDTAIKQGMAAMNEAQPLMPAQAAEAGAASMMPIQNFDLSNRFIDQNPYSLAALADNMRANLGQQQQSPVMAAMMQGFGEELEEERLRGLGFR